MGNLLELNDVSLVYDAESGTKVRAVDGVSFSVRRGEVFGLVGESGCGKTTTGKVIVKLLQPTSGTVTYDGRDITKIRSRGALLDYRSRVQMIFQDPYASLDPRMKVKDILAEGLRIHKRISSERELERKVAELLLTVGLREDYASRYPHEFSGGQRQRIGIARALSLDPEFLVCDEPISALDVSIQAQIINLLSRLKREKNFTYLFISHDLSIVRYLSDRVGVMCAGRLVELGSAEAVYTDPLHPYTQSLISAIPRPDPISEQERRRVAYRPESFDGQVFREAKPGHYVLEAAS